MLRSERAVITANPLREEFPMISKLLFAAALTTAIAAADVRVDNIVVNQSAPIPEGTNIRVNLMNDGPSTLVPGSVELQARDTGASDWHTIKVWDQKRKIAPGEKLSFDFLPARGEVLDPTLQQPTYELRAVVNGVPGPMSSFEYQYTPGLDIR